MAKYTRPGLDVHPLVRLVSQELRNTNAGEVLRTYDFSSKLTIMWRAGHEPGAFKLETLLKHFGYELALINSEGEVLRLSPTSPSGVVFSGLRAPRRDSPEPSQDGTADPASGTAPCDRELVPT